MKSLAALFIVLVAVNCVASRWLPTRDNSDRLDKLREMLKDILESEYEKSLYNRGAIFKREVRDFNEVPPHFVKDAKSDAKGIQAIKSGR